MAVASLQLPLEHQLKEGTRRMGAKKQQTHAKRARELAVKERRERKQAKKAEAAAQRAAGGDTAAEDNDTAVSPQADVEDDTAETFAPEGVR